MDKELARHEAGHAITAHALGVEVFRVELSHNGGGCTYYDSPSTMLNKGRGPTFTAIAYGKIAAAGKAAAPGTAFSASDNDSFDKAFWLFDLSDVSFDVFRDASYVMASELINKHADKVERVAVALIERGYLSADEFLELMRDD